MAGRLLDALIGAADVFVCNLSPAAITRLGLDAGALAARHPRLIACQLSGYGDEGPYADRKAYDLLVQAEAGVLAVTGSPAEPAKVGISVADIAGGMYAYSGILTALLQRERTGHGGVVRTSLFGALAEWMSHPMLLASLTGTPPARNGPRHATIVPYGSYLTADGTEILIAVQNEDEWARLCREVVDLPELATGTRYAGNQRRVERRDEVEDLLARAIGRVPAGELVRRLRQPVSPTQRCARSGRSWPTRSSRAGGCRSAPAGARCRCCRHRSRTAGLARCSGRCRGTASTPMRCWPSSRPRLTTSSRNVGAMCRNITTLRGLQPQATPQEIEAAARQYVRKVSGVQTVSARTEAAVDLAVRKVAEATTELLAGLPPRQQPPPTLPPLRRLRREVTLTRNRPRSLPAGTDARPAGGPRRPGWMREPAVYHEGGAR